MDIESLLNPTGESHVLPEMSDCEIYQVVMDAINARENIEINSIRKKRFGPRETQVALGNVYSLKEYLVLWVAPDVFGCLWLSLGVFGSLWVSLKILCSFLGIFHIVTFLWRF